MGVELDSINFLGLVKKLRDVAGEKEMLEIHKALIRHCEPYVPKDEGVLIISAKATSEYAQWGGKEAKGEDEKGVPYARYMYREIVYGPNYPIWEHGEIVGYWSPPHKHPTGALINYNKEKHSLAGPYWDKRMLNDKKDVFLADVKKILVDKLKEGGNG